ncbi:MAG: TonB-dependent receptor, partial [Bacteroidota bacterium]|nr:TonB-dependent receptor [Bacteroidota bacterium]
MARYQIISFLFVICLSNPIWSQVQNLMVKADHTPAADFFIELSLQSGINIIYNDNLIEQLPPVTLVIKGVSVDEILNIVLKGSLVTYRYVGDQIVLVQQEMPAPRYTISGVVTDSISGEPLISAFVYDELSGKSTQTNDYGYYSINLNQGKVRLLTGYLGYISRRYTLDLQEDIILHLLLHQLSYLPEVVVKEDRRFDPDQELIPHADRITLKELQSSIQIGGARDLYRMTDFLPGIHTGTDGVGGIHVRGGANDQNLILMDGVPVYHPNHLLGIISVFNSQVLQQASIYKANFPSKFSGRLSSVMDVRTREGNINEWNYSGNIGLSEFGLMVEGPIIPEKVAVLFGGRFFLPGLFIPDFTRRYKAKNGVGGYADLDYYDFNGKINWKAGLRDRLYLSFYKGTDKFNDFTITDSDKVDEDSGIRIVSHEEFGKDLNWSNRTGVFRWNHILTDKIFTNLILSSSSFILQSIDSGRFQFTFPETSLNPLSGFDTKEFKSSIRDITARLEMDIRPSTDHQLSAGIYGIDYKFLPKSITINEESKVGEFFLEEGLLDDAIFSDLQVNSFEAGLYIEDKWEIEKGLQLTSGLHISTFFVQQQYYLDPQLRMTLDYQPQPEIAFNIGYSRMTQYLHNLTSSSIGLPTDLWVPTTKEVRPALSDQYQVSAQWRPVLELTFNASAYIKNMRNLVNYQEGASFILGDGIIESSIVDAGNWEDKVTIGIGRSSGLELQSSYEKEKIHIGVTGTWSRAYRLFEEINSGKPFPDRYD